MREPHTGHGASGTSPDANNPRLLPQERALHRTESLSAARSLSPGAKVHRLALPELPHRTVCRIEFFRQFAERMQAVFILFLLRPRLLQQHRRILHRIPRRLHLLPPHRCAGLFCLRLIAAHLWHAPPHAAPG